MFKTGNLLNSIKTRLLFSFILVIFILLLQIIYLSNIHFTIVAQYRDVTDNLVLENKFADYLDEFVQSYYNVVNSPGSRERIEKYDQIHDEIENAFSRLDDSIISDESRIAYRGLKNYIMNIVSIGDEGIDYIKEGKLIESIEKYEDMSLKTRFINENSANLLVSELSYAEDLESEIERTHENTIRMVFVLIISVSLLCVLFAVFFSKRITDPLVSLAEMAKRISEGDLRLKVDGRLLEKRDEIGALSNSFKIMLKRLNTEIDLQKKISNDLAESRKDLEKRNDELERFNRLAVGRELRMVELKKRIRELEGKLEKHNISKTDKNEGSKE